MMMIRRITAAAVLMALTGSPAAAQLPSLPVPKDMPPPVPSAKAAPGQKLTPEAQLLSPEDFAARRKLGAFITCLNGVTGIIPNLARPYRDAFRAVSKDPANGLDRTSYTWMYQSKFLFHGPATMGHPPTQECADRLTTAVAQPPADEPLDTLATTYAADLRKLDVLAPKVEAYYNGKDFRDDGMAQGREMNAEYDPLLQRLLVEGHEMFTLTRAREAVLQQRRLDGIERLDGKQLRWQANAFMVQARAALDSLQALVAAKRRWCTWRLEVEIAPNPRLLCGNRLATDRVWASSRQHPVQHRHADGSLSLLGREAAGPQTRSDQRLVATHCRFH